MRGMKNIDSPELVPDNRLRRSLIQGIAVAGAGAALLPGSLIAATSKTIQQLYSKDEVIAKIVKETGLSLAEVSKVMHDVTFIPSIIKRMTTPYESRPYAAYRPLFVNKRLEKMGRQYLKEQKAVFEKVEKKFHVEAEVIAAILGLETKYGRHKGSDRILDSLYTLASGYPRRADFFRRELGEFLLLSREEKLQPTKLLGSYAGAFGTTQFIPSSYRAYAVDADGDGRRNVWESPEDIISSVANYFKKHGWSYGRPSAFWLTYTPALKSRADAGFKSWSTLSELRDQLPKLPAIWNDDDKVAIIEMETSKGKQMALIHYNFYVITRWNRSYNYAMATTEVAAMLGGKTLTVS